MKNIIYGLVLFLWGVLFSCNPQPEALSLLRQAQQLAHSHPERAIVCIDSIYYPEKGLNKEQYMEYLVAHTQVYYKNYRDISTDTLIFNARDYFLKKEKDFSQLTLAQFYSGCVYREQGDNETAMFHYQEALTSAEKTGDASLMGLITYNMGDLLANEGNYEKALESYKKAATLYEEMSEDRVYTSVAIGQMFLLCGKVDSALWYLHQGLDIADNISNSSLQSLINQNLSVTYKEDKQYDQAEKHLRQAFMINQDTTERVRYFLNFAELYQQMGQHDSVRLYAGKLEESRYALDDAFFKASAYNFLAEQAKDLGEFEKAFSYQEERMGLLNQIASDQSRQSVYEIQQKYKNELLQNKYGTQLIRNQHGVIAFLLFLFVVILAIYYLRKRMQIAKREELKMHDNVQIMRKTTLDLVELGKEHQSRESLLKELLVWKFDLLRQILSQLHKKPGKEQGKETYYKLLADDYNQIFFGDNKEKPYVSIIETIELLNPELSEFVHENYALLTEAEYNTLLLSYGGLSVKEIALLFNQSESTVYKTRGRLNEKIGDDFLTILRKKHQG